MNSEHLILKKVQLRIKANSKSEETMYIQKVGIQNFRTFGHEGVSFLFDKGINVVIGENNNGKTALIDAIRIAFSCTLYKKDIFFSKTDFHVNAAGERATSAQIDIYLKDVPRNLIEIWDPIQTDSGEFHVAFTIEKTPSGIERIKPRVWGGKCEGNPLSSDTLEAINFAYLSALRDATNEMKPSRNSKLAKLLDTIASRPEEKDALVEKLRTASQEILQTESLDKTKQVINENLFSIERDLLYQKVDLGLVEPKFESIMSSLRSWIIPRWHFIGTNHRCYTQIKELESLDDYKAYIHQQENGLYIDVDTLISEKRDLNVTIKEELLALKKHSFEIFQNGLGYNNLLFISAVLGDMSFDKDGIHENLFLVEEPEAHLHPQLQELILNFFCKKTEKHNSIQVIMTSHSPTLVSKIGIKNINLLYENQHKLYNYPLITAGLSNEESDYLDRYLDVTKSQLFFARGVIFVEGISEAILLPDFAKLINRPLDMYAVEVVNINGVGFSPFAKMMKVPDRDWGFAKASVVTDDDRCSKKDDPTYISKDIDFDDDLTGIKDKIKNGTPSDRFKEISTLCCKYSVKCVGAVKTFEYTLALEDNNVTYMLDAISVAYPTAGQKLKEKVDAEPNREMKALMIWLFIRSRNTAKAQFAQALSRALKKQLQAIENSETIESPFVIPQYIKEAIFNVTREAPAMEEY